MRVMDVTRRGDRRVSPLVLAIHVPAPTQIFTLVLERGVCRTDLHVVDCELNDTVIPLVPGHEIVGRVEQRGERVTGFEPGARVGIPWLAWSCGDCAFCLAGRE